MKHSGKKIWIDFTDLMTWNGHFTGTQRVTYEIGRRYFEQKRNVSFFAYDEGSKYFFEISFSKIVEAVKKSQEKIHELSKNEISNPSLLPKNPGIPSKAFAIYRKFVPYDIRRRVSPDQKKLFKKIYFRINNFRKSLKLAQKKSLKPFIQSTIQIHFTNKDTVIILGKPWDTKTFIEVLKENKLQENFKLVHLIYDMIPIFLPHVFGKPLPENYTQYMFEAISIANHLVAISESTRNDIKRFCEEENLLTPTTSVIRLGDRIEEISGEDQPLLELGSEDFILSVGTLEIRKNHILLYTAYKEAIRRGLKTPKLVIVGGLGWYTGDVIYEFQNDPELKDKVLFKHHVTDPELKWLYKNCKFSVYPSVYEGWGLPIAESLSYGKLCLASSAASMPEIAGSLIDYFSPYNSGELVDLLAKYLNKTDLIRKEADIKKTYKQTTWDQTFANFVKLASN